MSKPNKKTNTDDTVRVESSPTEVSIQKEESTLRLVKSDQSANDDKKEKPYLIQLSGQDTGRMILLHSDKIILGRDGTSNIILEDPHVSRHHAEITYENGQFFIKDLESTNGIFINGRRVKLQILQNGDKILLGTRLYFKFAFQDSLDENFQQSLFNAANLDALTQLYNKKYFLEEIQREFAFATRTNSPLTLMMLDIDHFKIINDTYGHLSGDEVLKKIGHFLGRTIRLENITARFGGEEFAILFRNLNADLALGVGLRIKEALAKVPFHFQNTELYITVSIGIATLYNSNYKTPKEFIEKTDKALYSAKRNGRNRVQN